MGTLINILHRLARFLAGLPPELLGAMILVALERPELILAVALWMLEAILGQLFVTILFAILMVYVWSRLAPWQRRALRRAVATLLPKEVADHLGIMPSDDPAPEEVEEP